MAKGKGNNRLNPQSKAASGSGPSTQQGVTGAENIQKGVGLKINGLKGGQLQPASGLRTTGRGGSQNQIYQNKGVDPRKQLTQQEVDEANADGGFDGSTKVRSDHRAINNIEVGEIEFIDFKNVDTEVDDNAWDNEIHLKEVVRASKLQKIGVKSFYNTGSYTFPFGESPDWISIGEGAFQNSKLKGSVSFGVVFNFTTIGTNAFRNTEITSVNLPWSLVNWGDSVFADNKKLSDLTLSAGSRKVGDSGFANCPLLKRFKMPNMYDDVGGLGELRMETIGDEAFLNSGRKAAGGDGMSLDFNNNETDEAVFTGEYEIGDGAFKNVLVSSSSSLDLRKAQTIGAEAFACDYELFDKDNATLTINLGSNESGFPNNFFRSVGDKAFKGIPKKTNITASFLGSRFQGAMHFRTIGGAPRLARADFIKITIAGENIDETAPPAGEYLLRGRELTEPVSGENFRSVFTYESEDQNWTLSYGTFETNPAGVPQPLTAWLLTWNDGVGGVGYEWRPTNAGETIWDEYTPQGAFGYLQNDFFGNGGTATFTVPKVRNYEENQNLSVTSGFRSSYDEEWRYRTWFNGNILTTP